MPLKPFRRKLEARAHSHPISRKVGRRSWCAMRPTGYGAFPSDDLSTEPVLDSLVHRPRSSKATALLAVVALGAVVALVEKASVARRAADGGGLDAAQLLAQNRASLSFSVRSEDYAPLSDHTIALYARFSHVVEPHRRTVLRAASGDAEDDAASSASSFHWHVARLASSARTAAAATSAEGASSPEEEEERDDDEEALLYAGAGREARVFFADVSRRYRVRLTEERSGGARRTIESTTVTCKYVRREIRDLTTDDRDRYFSALDIVYNTSMADGVARYGARAVVVSGHCRRLLHRSPALARCE